MGLGLYTRSVADDKGVNVTNIKRLLAGILCVLFAFGTVPVTAYANKDDGLHRTVVVGYFEKSNFQEGMDDDSMKSGYGYEYIQKIAGYTGWKYEYVYGTFQELIEMLMDGSIDMLAGVSYSDERAERINYAKYSMHLQRLTESLIICVLQRRELIYRMTLTRHLMIYMTMTRSLWKS